MKLGPRAVVVFTAVAAGAALFTYDCAKRGLPPGGPEDKTPPRVESVSPIRGSVGADLESEVRITFSEPMKRRTVETSVVVSPPCRWIKRYWRDNTYILVPGEALLPETTYLISVGIASADRHGVRLEKTFVSGFSTGSTIEAGVISGKTVWKNLSVEEAIVQVYDVGGVRDAAGFPKAPPIYVTYSGAGGQFEIPFVDPKSIYKVFALIDKNGNAEYDAGETIGCAAGDVNLADSARAAGIEIVLCDGEFKGAIAGRVGVVSGADTTGRPDEFKVAVTADLVADTAASYRDLCDQRGEFRITCVKPGPYVLGAFADFNGNQRKDPEDRFSVQLEETLLVRPCAEASSTEMTLKVGSGP